MNPVQSARIRTAETFAFKYGRVEVSARLPRGDWMWPAIWMLPASSAYGTWPVSGEIDIMVSAWCLWTDHDVRLGVTLARVPVLFMQESRGNARGYPAGGKREGIADKLESIQMFVTRLVHITPRVDHRLRILRVYAALWSVRGD